MKTIQILALAGGLALGPLALAPMGAAAADTYAPLAASDADPASFIWQKRPVLVFADSPEDPNFIRQLELLARDPAALEERDVVVITDSDPAAKSAYRTKLRPRGFSLVILDKDGEPELRKPLPWDVREITRAIDKFPLRRQEMLEQRPGR